MAIHGVSILNHAIAESALAGDAAPTGANAIPLEELNIKPNREFVDIREFQRTANRVGWIQGKVSGEWDAKQQWRLPSGLGVLPEMDVIIANAFGTAATVVGSTSVTYNESTFDQAPGSFTLVQAGGGPNANGDEFFLHAGQGCVCKKLTLTIEGGAATYMEAEGEFADYGYLFGAPTTDTELTSTDTDVSMNTGNGRFLREGNGGLYVQIGTDDNSGAGYRITNSTTADHTTIATAGGAAGTIASGSLIRPLIVTPTFAGEHLTGIVNNLNLDDGVNTAVDLGFIKAVIEFETGLHLLNKEATSEFASQVGRTMRKIGGQITFYLENDMAFLQVGAFDGTQYDVELRAGGTTAGSRYRINMPGTRFEVTNEMAFEFEDEGVEVTASFENRRTSGENAIQIVAD